MPHVILRVGTASNFNDLPGEHCTVKSTQPSALLTPGQTRSGNRSYVSFLRSMLLFKTEVYDPEHALRGVFAENRAI